ncbi:MAG: propionyl-CoA carboxylase [Chloroflexi bacterium]|nr:propionyl-CoA carboxylase [Chloroflexota bacterium]
MGWQAEVEELRQRRTKALELGGPERIKRQHDTGRLTVRERIERLVDPGTFFEVGQLAGGRPKGTSGPEHFTPSGYVFGMAQIAGRQVFVGGEDFTVRGGSEGGAGSLKNHAMQRMALDCRVPVVLLLDGSGASIRSIDDMGYSGIPRGNAFATASQLSGRVPLVAAALGTNAGGPALIAPLADIVIMVKGTSQMFSGGPPLIERAMGIKISKEDLGGTWLQVDISGTADLAAESEEHCLELVRRYLSYFPQNCWELPPRTDTGDPPDRRAQWLLEAIPRNLRRPYSMPRVLEAVFDQGSLFEIRPTFGKSLITTLARLDGHPVGVIANNPLHIAGAIDSAAADKQVHFMQVCDAFHLPLIYCADVPGFMIGQQAEREAVLRRGMRVAYVAANLRVPTITLVLHKAYGMGAAAMGGTGSGAHVTLAWPSAQFGGIPIEGGVMAAFRREIEAAPDPERKRREIEERLDQMRTPWLAAEHYGVEDVIDPRDTRPVLIRYLEMARNKSRSQLGPRASYGIMP